MARDLMPKSGIVMPHIVVTRDAAIVGVSTVDGRAGAITLGTTYAAIADVYKKTETYSQAQVDNLITPIMTRALFKDDPYINNNVALRSGGANGITSIDLIKADTDNSIHVGDLAAGVQGIHLYSEGKVDIAYKDANGADAVASLYSQRYRPATSELPFAVVGTYITDAKGRTTGVNKNGNNSDIRVLNSLNSVTTNAVTFEKSPIVPTPTTDTATANKKYVDDAVANAPQASGGYVGEAFWHPSRTKLPGGTAPADGQLISGALALYPQLVAEIQAGNLPNTTEATWQAQPTARAAYVYDSTANTLRMPDLNGKQTGSIAAPVMRGDGGGLTDGSVQKSAVPNIKGSTTANSRYSPVESNAVQTGPFSVGATNMLGFNGNGGSTTASALTFDAKLVSDVFVDGVTEARMNSVVGVYVIRVATETQNGGDIDMLQLQAQVEALRSAAVATNNSIGYALVTAPGTPALNSRTVIVNPFGNTTPVICMAEIYHATLQTWIASPWFSGGTSSASIGLAVAYHEGEGIVLKTGSSAYIATTPYSGSSVDVTGANYTTPSQIRVHVWSIGKDISKLKQISQIDPVLIQEFKAPVIPTGLREVWRSGQTSGEGGSVRNAFTLSESILGKNIYFQSASPNDYGVTTFHMVPIKPSTQPAAITISGAPTDLNAPTCLDVFVPGFITGNGMGMWALRSTADGKRLWGRWATSGVSNITNIFVEDYSVQP